SVPGRSWRGAGRWVCGASPATGGCRGSAGCSSSRSRPITCCGFAISPGRRHERANGQSPDLVIEPLAADAVGSLGHSDDGDRSLLPPFFHSLLRAILPRGDHESTGLTQAGVLPLWRRLSSPLLHRGCFNGGPADCNLPAVLAADLARGHPRLRTRASRPSRLSSPSCSERRG